MAQLFRRAYVLAIKVAAREVLRITDLDVAFQVTRSLKPEPNTCEIEVRNLTEEHRRQIEEHKTLTVQLSAGYQRPPGAPESTYSAVSLIFSGDLREIDTVREGPDLITRIASGDGEKSKKGKRVSATFNPGATIKQVAEAAARALGAGLGNFRDIKTLRFQNLGDVFSGGTVLSGNAADELDRILKSAGQEYSIQNGQIQVLPRGAGLAGEAIVLSPDTGLEGSPTISSDGVLKARTRMIPDLFPGRVVEMRSEYAKGQWVVQKCDYRGDTAGQDWGVELEAKQPKRRAT